MFLTAFISALVARTAKLEVKRVVYSESNKIIIGKKFNTILHYLMHISMS